MFIEILPQSRLEGPSGIVYHPQRDSLYVVGDEGDIIEFGLDGVERAAAQHPEHGYEGITCTRDGVHLYAAIERDDRGVDRIVEITPELELTGREIHFTWPKRFKPRGKDGIEGVALLTEDTEAQELVFWVCQQAKPAVVHQLQVSWKLASGPVVEGEIVASYQLRKRRRGADVVPAKKRKRRKMITDLSGLHVTYDRQQGEGELVVLSDGKNRCYRIGICGASLASRATAYRLPKSVGQRLFNQEGITITERHVVIANDAGGVYVAARETVFPDETDSASQD